MPELTADDVESFTGGRLTADDEEVQRMLAAALGAARRHCGWHVNPVVADDSVTLDGPGSRILNLPTRKLVDLTSLVEDGRVVPLDAIGWSAGGPPGALSRPISVRKKSGGWWKAYYQCITVVMTHGYTDDEAADWRYAVLSMVDQMGQLQVSGRGEGDLLSKKVDDVTYRWADPYAAAAESSLYSVNSLLCTYALPPLEFM
jgi:hypothetical protein